MPAGETVSSRLWPAAPASAPEPQPSAYAAAASPARGRPRHCLNASHSSSTPSSTLAQFTHRDGPSAEGENESANSSTATPTSRNPNVQPARNNANANARPSLRVRNISGIMVNGSDDSRMPVAMGRDWTMAGSMDAASTQPRYRLVMG